VQTAERQATARQMGIERRDTERRGPAPQTAIGRAALDSPNPRAQIREITLGTAQGSGRQRLGQRLG